MSVLFQAASAPVSSASASSGTIVWPGTPSGQMLIAVFGFENVLASSGPWVIDKDGSPPGSATGWLRSFYRPPSADGGCGLEVWNSYDWSSGIGGSTFHFDASRPFVAQGLVYTGQYFDGTTDPFRAFLSQPWTGDNPKTPSIYAFGNELLLAVAAEQMASPGFGTPTPAGWVQRFDSKRSAFGNVEITAADLTVSGEGASGIIPWAASAAGPANKGATAVVAVRPAAAVPTSTSPLIAVTFPTT